MKNKMMLIDGSSLIFRAFYAIRHLTTADGIHTNGVYGFLSMYYNIIEKYNPTHVLVAFDRSTPTFRHADYEKYKGTRQETPSELSSQFGILKDVLESMKVKTLDMDGYEADDICGTLAELAVKNGMEAILVTGDKDYLQLVDEDIQVVLTRKGISEVEEYGIEEIKAAYGVSPKQLIDVKGLMGDASDNIPGVPGVGEKTALKLIQQFGSIQNLYAHIDEVSGKAVKQKLIDNEGMAQLSRKLGEIFTEVPLDDHLENYRLTEPDAEALAEKFDRLEFRTFRDKLGMDKSATIEDKVVHRVGVTEYEKVAGELSKSTELSLFPIYDGDNYTDANLIAIGLQGSDHNHGFFFDLKEDAGQFEEAFKRLLEGDGIRKIAFDVKESIYLLKQFNIDLAKNYGDVMLMEYLVDPTKSVYHIDQSARNYIDQAILSKEDILGKGKKKKSFLEVEEQSLLNFVGGVLSVLPRLHESLYAILEEREMLPLYVSVELPLSYLLADMEREGVLVDLSVLDELNREFEDNLKIYEEAIYGFSGYEFNINSPKQLGEVLFETLELPVIKKTKTGYSTDVEVLEKLRGQHDIVDYILHYRSVSKLKSTYIDGLRAVIQDDGRIRTTFRQNVAATGRISSTDPNLQNIPVKTEEGRRIRKAFVAKEGAILLDGDYSQIELRVLAHLSNDKNMIEAFNEDLDIHRKTASEVFHVPLDEVTNFQRSSAKAVNFGIVYGISDYGLSRDLDISRKEAKNYIDNYLASYPGIQGYMADIVEDAKSIGYVETILHRRRYVPELNSKNFNIRGFGERIALNTPIQGSAADIIKIAMVRIYFEMARRGLKSKLILQVHDELIIETPEDEVEEVRILMKQTMEEAYKMEVALKVDINVGKNWYDAK